MKSKFPIKSLKRVNWLLNITSIFFVFSFVILFKKETQITLTVIFAILTFVFLSLGGLLNIAVLLFLEKRLVVNSFKFKFLRYTCNIILNSIAYNFTLLLCFTYLNDWILTPLIFLYCIFLSFFVAIIATILQDFIILLEAKAKSDLENSYLKTAHAEAANQILRQQIQPHFLFNALNTLKSLYKKNPTLAENYIVHLSDFLRASVSYNNAKISCLKDEIKLCLDYLEMQKIRFDKALNFTIQISDEILESGYVPSFSVQPLLENAIKHNELTEESPLHVFVKQEGDKICVVNNLRPKAHPEVSTKSGLSNLSERYKLMSNDELIIENDGETFSVKMIFWDKKRAGLINNK